MSEPANTEDFASLAHSPSFEMRSLCAERLDNLPDADHCKTAMILFASPYRDLWEATLETCTSERVSSQAWKDALSSWIKDSGDSIPSQVEQAIILCIRRMDGEPCDEFMEFAHRCLESKDPDVQYQAFCLAELQEETSEEYQDFVHRQIDSKDLDFRIVAIQAIRRLKPSWGLDVLKARALVAYGEEAFQTSLATYELNPEGELRENLDRRLTAAILDSRFSFPAIEAAAKYKVTEAVPVLLKTAKGFFTEPTVKVAAAGAAAMLGSEEGRKLLVKFATSKRGNPDYANELLDKVKAIPSQGHKDEMV